MTSPVARLGDTSQPSHFGTISSASTNVKANGIGVARQGDTFNCTIHGPGQTLISIAPSKKVNGEAVITVGATTSCGATIAQGSPSVNA